MADAGGQSPSSIVKFIIGIGVVAVLALIGTFFLGEPAVEGTTDPGVVNLYSSRHYDTDVALYENFTEATGIKVNRIEAGADALIERIKVEGDFSPADLLITVDAGHLWRAEQAGILASVDSPALKAAIPANLRHPEGLWFGLSTRARVIIVNTDAELGLEVTRYQDLADPALRGKVCIRSSSNIYNISLLAALISHLGPEAAEDWAKGVVANFARKPQGNDTAHIRAISSGECAVGLVNSYYLARILASDDPADKALMETVRIIFPNQDSTGAHVNISGAALLKHAPNRMNAVRFLEYLASPEAQGYLASGNNEYPVLADAPRARVLDEMGAFKADTLSAAELGRNQLAAIRMFDRAGWQ